MPPLQEIPFDHVKVIYLAALPMGAIFQIADSNGSPVVGLRCQLPTANGVALGFIPLEGQEVGIFVTDEPASQLSPVIDITSFVTLVAVSPAPLRGREPKAGFICQVEGRNQIQFLGLPVFLIASGGATLEGFAHLESSRRGVVEKGTLQIIIGTGEVVPLK